MSTLLAAVRAAADPLFSVEFFAVGALRSDGGEECLGCPYIDEDRVWSQLEVMW